MEAAFLGILAGSLQSIGYFVYGFKVLRKEILPNPASWLMFAYGTTLLVILEWDRDANFAILALPIVCSILSLTIAAYCLRRVRRAWLPEHPLERFSFALDVTLTFAYLSAWILLAQNLIEEDTKSLAEICILIFWNIGIFTAFFPLLRQVYHHPASEHAIPWVIWTCAYATLAIATIMQQHAFDELALYPLINTAVHGFIASRVAYAHWKSKYVGGSMS